LVLAIQTGKPLIFFSSLFSQAERKKIVMQLKTNGDIAILKSEFYVSRLYSTSQALAGQ
jgi:hypothetical protein